MITIFEDIKITMGYNRSLLLDFTKGRFEFLDNDVARLLNDLSNYISFEELIVKNDKFKCEIIQLREWFVFNEFSSDDFVFPKISPFNESSYPFQCITIEISEEILNHIKQIFSFFIELTQNLIFIVNSEKEILKVMDLFQNYEHIHIQFLTKDKVVSSDDIQVDFKNISVDYYHERIKNHFDISIATNNFIYRENLNYNSGYFEKLFIKCTGEIAVNIFDDFVIGNLIDLKNKSDFTKLKNHELYKIYANSKSDQIQVCKECELRYTCTDLQQPKMAKSGFFYKEKECDYNPFISKWKNEDGYKTLIECGITSNEKGFSIDLDKIASINSELWIEEVESE
jgi:hypothetical protein